MPGMTMGTFWEGCYAYKFMDACVKQVGWNNWGKLENERNACFYEYKCFGPGSSQLKRVKELVDEEAEEFLGRGFIDSDPQRPWLALRMAVRIPYAASDMYQYPEANELGVAT